MKSKKSDSPRGDAVSDLCARVAAGELSSFGLFRLGCIVQFTTDATDSADVAISFRSGLRFSTLWNLLDSIRSTFEADFYASRIRAEISGSSSSGFDCDFVASGDFRLFSAYDLAEAAQSAIVRFHTEPNEIVEATP